jgi:hypothetical protein
MNNKDKQDVHDFWDRASCGEELFLASISREGYADQAAQRYALEPYIPVFADFAASTGMKCWKSASAWARIISVLPRRERNSMALT